MLSYMNKFPFFSVVWGGVILQKQNSLLFICSLALQVLLEEDFFNYRDNCHFVTRKSDSFHFPSSTCLCFCLIDYLSVYLLNFLQWCNCVREEMYFRVPFSGTITISEASHMFRHNFYNNKWQNLYSGHW